MKKILSFVLVLAMVLGSVSMAFAKTATFSDVKGLSCEEAVNVLAGLGVIDGYPDGEFKPARNITRAEAVKLVIGALAMPVDEKGSYETPFTDVPNDAWYAGYVLYANKLGITKGTSATEFSPNAMVTSDQMIAFAMRALGYTEAVLQGEYPACFINKAVGLKVLKGVSTGSQPAPRGEIAQLIYNCLTKQIGSVQQDGMWHGGQIADDADTTADKRDTMLRRLGAVPDTEWYLIDQDLMEDSLVDLSEYYGAVAKFYRTDDEDKNIVALSEVLTTFITGTVSGGKLDGHDFTGDYDVIDGKDNCSDAMLVINGDEDAKITGIDPKSGDYLDDDYTYAVEIKGGKIINVYSAQLWTLEDEQGQVIKVDKKLLEEIAEDKTIDNNDLADNYILVGADTLKDIEADNVLYLYFNTKGKIAKVEVGTEVAYGTFTKIKNNIVDGVPVNTYTVGGKGYELQEVADANAAKTLDDKANIGKDYTIFLGYDGKICFVEGESETSSNYAVFLKYWEPGRGNADNRTAAGLPGLTVYTTEGKEELYFADTNIAEADEDGVMEIVDDAEGTAIDEDTFDAGTLVEIERDGDGYVVSVRVIDPPEEADQYNITNKGRVIDASDKKVLAALNSKSVVFKYNGKDADKASSYSVAAPASLYGSDNVGIFQLDKGEKNGYVLATLIQGGDTSVNDIVVVTARHSTISSKGNLEVSTFVDGKADTVTAKASTFDPYVKPTVEQSAADDIYVVNKKDSDGVITKATLASEDEDIVMTIIATGTVLTIEDDVIFAKNDEVDAAYEIDDDAVFYVYDVSSKEWSIGSSSALARKWYDEETKKSNSLIEAIFIKTDSDSTAYDIFVIVKY